MTEVQLHRWTYATLIVVGGAIGIAIGLLR